jgi:hypothetical protein
MKTLFDLTPLSISLRSIDLRPLSLPALALSQAGETERGDGKPKTGLSGQLRCPDNPVFGNFTYIRLLQILALICIGVIFLPTISALAQDEGELILTLSRDFGYSSGTGRIQGTFTLKVSGPENLQRVVFLIDGQPIGEDTQAPFSIQFHTGSYPLGVHTLSAAGYTGEGRELTSNESQREFVKADEGGRAALRIAGPIIGVTFGIILLSTVLPIILGRRKGTSIPLGAPRSYGLLGGTICPKCGRPFGMHIWGFNLLVGKLDRCPHCGRWSLAQRFSPEALKAAEAAEVEMAEGDASEVSHSTEEALRKELDDSRYMDL